MSQPPLLEDLYRDIRPHLALVEREIGIALRSPRPAVASMIDHLGGYGGKRLRPALVMITAQAAGGRPSDPVFVRLGTVVEMIHLATLVHDDVIDEADLRRRRATVNARWTDYDAVLLGDIVFARAINLLARMQDQRSLLALTSAVSTLCEGEILQNRHRHDTALDERDYYGIIEAKTAVLYAAGCDLSAHLAGAPADVVQAFHAFGLELGKAFQIVDDCLDLTGKEEDVGKSLGTDLRLGKMTLPLILLRDEGDAADRRVIERVVGKGTPDAEDVALLHHHLRRAGTPGRALARARKHADAAVAAVRGRVPAEALATLESVAAFVFQRRS